jgi:hypothetical protein
MAELFEPEGLSVAGSLLYIADTNNHLVRVADLAAGTLGTLAIRGLERLRQAAKEDRAGIRVDPVSVAGGQVTLALDIVLPPGYKRNPEAPLILRQVPQGQLHTFGASETPTIDLQLEADRDVTLDLTLYPCQAHDERLCLVHDARLIVPLHISGDGPSFAYVEYRVPLAQA